MADHAEEQQMEAEALEAIFESHFSIQDPQRWSIELYPEHAIDECNVACRLIVDLPEMYPELALPNLSIEIITGLAAEHVQLLQGIASEEASANEGSPSIFAVAERLREWLLENNVKGLDDQSMHAQMMRKKLQESNQKTKQVCRRCLCLLLLG
jgi:RWD domain